MHRVLPPAVLAPLFPAALAAQSPGTTVVTREIVREHGPSAIWIFANISYAGMRAQNHPSALWRGLAFIFGFPGTLLSYFVVTEGGGRMYGIRLPRRSDAE